MIIFYIIIAINFLVKQLRISYNVSRVFFIIFILSLLVKIFSLLLYETSIISLIDAGSDSVGFKVSALFYYNSYSFWELLRFWDIQEQYGTFPILLAIIYKILGPHYLVFISINILLHNAVLLIFGRFLYKLNLSKNFKILILSFIGFFPFYISYSVILLREMFMIATISITTYNFIEYQIKGVFLNKLSLILFLNAISIILHPGMIIFSLFIITIILITDNKSISAILKNSIYVILIALVVFLIFKFQYGGGYFDSLFNYNSYQEVVNKFNLTRYSSIAYYNKLFNGNIFHDLTIALPHSLVNFLFSPFPYPFSNIFLTGIPRYLMGLITIIIFLLFIFNCKKFDKNTRILLLLFLVSILPFVMGSSDWMQAIRHRMKYMTILLYILSLIYDNYNTMKHIYYNEK